MTGETYNTVYKTAELADGCKDALEALIDKFGLPRVLDLLSVVAYEKSAHIEENWQDKQASKVWFKASVSIDNDSAKVRNLMEAHYGKMS